MLKTYYELTKPGIIYGNAFTAGAGFLLASKNSINFWLLLSILTGISLLIASACVFNNYTDRDIDKLMERTKKRGLAQASVPARNAIIYAVLLGLIGFFILFIYSNPLTVRLGIIAMFSYIVLYGWAKRNSVHGTLVGSVPGALPPVAGYASVTGRIDGAAIILFFILVFWQMAHFYSIAIYRADDYAAAKIPVLPAVKGLRTAKIHILFYITAFILAAILLSLSGYTGYIYLIAVILLGSAWIWLAIKGFSSKNNKLWAHKMFRFSLVVLMSTSVIMSGGVKFP